MHKDIRNYSVVIDHDKPLSERIGAGRYDYVDPYVTPANFPTPFMRKGKVETLVALVPLGQVMTTEEVLDLHRRLGVKPATIHELLAFGAAFPDMQKSHPIVAFGSSCVDQGEGPPSVPSLRSRRNGSRDLYLDWTEYRWDSKCHILTIPA